MARKEIAKVLITPDDPGAEIEYQFDDGGWRAGWVNAVDAGDLITKLTAALRDLSDYCWPVTDTEPADLEYMDGSKPETDENGIPIVEAKEDTSDQG